MKVPKFKPEFLADPGLRWMCERLLVNDPIAIEHSIAFIEAETLGVGHNRKRGKMSRRLKHCRLTPEQERRVVGVILERLGRGRFDEQFKDQLRLALHLAPAQVLAAARSYRGDSHERVRRNAEWILAHED